MADVACCKVSLLSGLHGLPDSSHDAKQWPSQSRSCKNLSVNLFLNGDFSVEFVDW